MASEEYSYDPESGQWYLVSGDASQLFEGDASTILNGKYVVSGTLIRDVETGRIAGNIGSGPITATRYTDAAGNVVVDLNSGISPATLNATGPRLASYRVAGDVTVLDHLGQEYSVHVDASSITGFGQRLLVYTGETGVQHYQAVTMGDEQEAAIRELYGDTARWATAREYSDAALIGYISRNESKLVDQIQRAGGMFDADGILQDTGSGIVRALVSIAQGKLSYSQGVRFSATGNFGSAYGT